MKNGKQPLYTTRITEAGALISDVKVLLDEWQVEQSIESNLERVRQRNLFGKITRGRTQRILRVFRQRYLSDPDVAATLVTLAQTDAPSQWLDPLLYFFAVQHDNTLHDAVVDVLYPRKQAGFVDLPVVVVQNAITGWVSEGKTSKKWNTDSIERVARGVMATLRDFGVLEGKVSKHINPIYLPLESFALIAFWLMQELKAGKLVLNSEEWRLFFLDVPGVERYFIEAHQEGLLSYYSAGSVVRLEFPASSLKEYADGFLERAH